MKKAILTLLIGMVALLCAAQNDTITNLTVSQRTDGSGMVDVYFSLTGQGLAYDITQVEVSFDAGSNYVAILPIYLSGDTSGILPGDSLHIVWDGMATHLDTYSAQTKVKLTAIEDCGCPPTLTDSDGNVYNTILIGDQCWMAENLKTGIMINAENIQADNAQMEKYCYDNNLANCETYGGLYQWNEAMQYTNQAGTQGICPGGWHIPTDAEWCTLTQFIDETVVCSSPQWSGTDVGTKMKSETAWEPGGSNTSGFTALPGGGFFIENFGELESDTYYWSSIESDNNKARDRRLNINYENIGRSSSDKINGYSVRCLKNANPQANLPAVGTESVTEITYSSAISGGNVSDDGGGDVTALGVVWSTTADPTIGNNEGMTDEGVGTGEFVSYLTELLPDALHYVKAYATNSAGTAYGEQLTFTTLSGLATLTTNSVIEITDISAVSGGNITEVDGGAEVVDRGCVWSTVENPTLEEYEGISNDGEGIGEYASYLTDLSIETLYYVRAYATSEVGTAYGQQRSFTTLAESFIPTLTTDSVTAITPNSATSGGNITDDGGEDVVDRGCVWSTVQNPTVENYEGISNDGEGIGEFVSYLTELLGNTTYYVRAYATNSDGTGYGQQEHFFTDCFCGTLSIVLTDYQGDGWNGGHVTVYVNDSAVLSEITLTVEGGYGPETHYFDTDIGDVVSTSFTCGAWCYENEYLIYDENDTLVAHEGAYNSTPGNVSGLNACTPFACGTSTIIDNDGNVYNTVLVGSQCWMKENLATTHYSNGTAIEYPGTDNTAWANNTTGAYAWYDNDFSWKDDYGALYNGYAVSNNNGLCPTGWHVPSDVDWNTIHNYLGGPNIAGGPMKSTRTTPDAHPRWDSPNSGATNDSDWTGLPGGRRHFSLGTYDFMGALGLWYGYKSEPDTTYYYISLSSTGIGSQLTVYDLLGGLSVRCLKDE